MPMLVVSDAELELEIARLAGEGIVEKVVDITRGRTLGKKEVSVEERKLIASEAIAGVKVEDIAREYNISRSSISAYKVGAVSTSSYHEPNKELAQNNNDIRKNISARAEEKILSSLGLLTEDKIAGETARNIAGITKDLSSIVKNMEPSIINQQNNQVILYRPRMKEEDDYEIIEVNG